MWAWRCHRTWISWILQQSVSILHLRSRAQHGMVISKGTESFIEVEHLTRVPHASRWLFASFSTSSTLVKQMAGVKQSDSRVCWQRVANYIF